jgi:hypothetical protein
MMAVGRLTLQRASAISLPAQWSDDKPLVQRGYNTPGLRELIALSLLAGLGCGLALAHGDLFVFVAVFGSASAMTVVEAIRRAR